MSATEYQANVRDAKFILWDMLEIQKLFDFPKYKEFDVETINMVIDQAAKFAEQELAPLNKEGDEVGCKFENGKVTVPHCFHEPYKKFCELGWVNITSSPEIGGQGLPEVAALPAKEYFMGANFSFCSYPVFSYGIGHLLEVFGSQELKDRYMERLYTGEFGGCMCLTEPDAGSDVGASKTTAKRAGDHFMITGTKQFITSGEHDLVNNNIHAVLARIEGAPAGTKGLTLFAVPKFRLNDDGSIGEFNDVTCVGIEEKIGIHGSSTCTLSYGDNGDCHGYIIGEENQGIAAMFQLMNEARIEVGIQSIAASSAAYLNSLAFAKERIQGQDIKDMKNPEAPAVEIIKHPDVRRMLLTQKAYAEGMRALLYYNAYLLDLGHNIENEDERKASQYRAELLTPICKAYCSDMAFRMCEYAVQVCGGYGATKDYPVEQYLRDTKIASIYEGTNGIQSMDLLGRKLMMKKGAIFMGLLEDMGKFAAENESNESIGAACKEVAAAKDKISEIAMHLGGLSMGGQIQMSLSHSVTFLMGLGHVIISWLLLWQAKVASEKINAIYKDAGATDDDARKKVVEENDNAAFYAGKIASAKFFVFNILPEIDAMKKIVTSGDTSVIDLPENAF